MGDQSPSSTTSIAQPPTPFDLAPVVEPTARWVRVRFGGNIIADSKRALLLIQYGPRRLPTYYFPQADVLMEALEPMEPETPGPQTEGFIYCRVRVGDQVANRAAWIYQDPPAGLAALQGYVSFDWGRMEAWYEEEEQIFVHARDPHKRVDVLASSRHVRVEIAGETLAETHRPFLLFETNLPTRYYIPAGDVRMDLLEPTGVATRCPYKGVASYWSATVGDKILTNVVWSYPDPIPENPRIKGLLCFFNERVDLYVDGDLQSRPRTPWSE
jgi:uncharacterized protein (DUF427 family)